MLTAKQAQVFQFIQNYMTNHRYAPTESEIAAGIGISSRGVVHRYVTALANEGLIRITPSRRRNIELISEYGESSGGLPILGKIAAGSPIDAIEDLEMFQVNEALVKPNRFILVVKGSSMIGDNICDGDLVVCDQANTARPNDIVALLIENQETTLKRMKVNTDGTVTLIPSNPDMSPMIYPADQVQVQGLYVGLVRLK